MMRMLVVLLLAISSFAQTQRVIGGKNLHQVITLKDSSVGKSKASATVDSFGQTKAINIGSYTYRGTFKTLSDGSAGASSDFDLYLDAEGVTVDPIVFGNVIFRVKGASLPTKGHGFTTITTGPGGCIDYPDAPPCELIATGEKGAFLPACGTLSSTGVLTQNCIAIAVQLISLTGKNFSFQLVDGETFCAPAITNIFVDAKANQLALDGRCDINNFCYGESVPVVIHALPAQNCQ